LAVMATVENGKVVVIEKVGEEEGFGTWSLKRLVIERPRSSTRNEFGEEIDGDNPVVMLYSYNPQVKPWQLDPSGRLTTPITLLAEDRLGLHPLPDYYARC